MHGYKKPQPQKFSDCWAAADIKQRAFLQREMRPAAAASGLCIKYFYINKMLKRAAAPRSALGQIKKFTADLNNLHVYCRIVYFSVIIKLPLR